jgi:serine protease Do
MSNMKSSLGLITFIGGLALAQLPLAAKETSSAMDLARQLNQAFIEVADRVSSAVVVIRVAHKPDYTEGDEDNHPFFDLLPELRRRYQDDLEKRRRQRSRHEPVFDGQGSGVVIREDGYILTNSHVVDGADKIKVRFKDGKEYDAQIRGVDPQSDIAVIKIDPKTAKDLTVAKLGDSSKTRVGEFAIAIGAPFELDYSVTFGHISAKGRRVFDGRVMVDQDFLQTDASINPGNSGGPLVNIDGEVIGINTLIRGMNRGIGFAVPVNLAKEVAEKLIADGKFTRSWLGVLIRSLNEDAEYKNLVESVKEGVVVRGIDPRGPAYDSELQVADVITAVDGKSVATADELKNEIRTKEIGKAVNLDIVRDDKKIKIKVKTAALPDETIQASYQRKSAEEHDAKDLGLKEDSLAARKGIKVGDIITKVNRKKIATAKEFRDAVKSADLKKGLVIHLVSDGSPRFEILKDSGD